MRDPSFYTKMRALPFHPGFPTFLGKSDRTDAFGTSVLGSLRGIVKKKCPEGSWFNSFFPCVGYGFSENC